MTPTQAQIDAAAKAIHETNCDVDGDEPCTFCIDAAEAALTAAAEVGHHVSVEFLTELVKSAELKERTAIIERCAQVAEATRGEDGQKINVAGEIAAAIRALATEGQSQPVIGS